MKEREISLIDLLVEILQHWRIFIVWMLAGAVLLGTFSFYRSRNAISSQEIQAERSPEEGLSEDEIRNVKYLITYENAYLLKENYLENSILMHMDPNLICKADATVAVISEDDQKSYDIKKVYENIVQSSELIEKMEEDNDGEMTGVEEVILLDKDLAALEGITLEDSENTNIFRIVVMNSDEVRCKEMLDTIIEFLKEKQPELKGALGEHEIIVVNQSVGVASYSKIAEMQKKDLDNLGSMKRMISDTKANLSDAEKQYYDFLANGGEGTEETEEPAVSESTVLSVSLKYVILGALIAAFLYVMILFVAYIFNTKVRVTDNLQELYDIPQLGTIPAEEGHKKLFGFIDQWILSIRTRNKRQFTSEEALELAVVAAKMSAGKEAMQEICLVGCGLKEQSLAVCEKIKARLQEDKIQIDILNNILYDAKMMEELESARGVILVESVGSTLYSEIAEELEILKRQRIKVLGGILVE